MRCVTAGRRRSTRPIRCGACGSWRPPSDRRAAAGSRRRAALTVAGRRLRLGFQVWGQYVAWPELMAAGRDIDELGFDELWSNDHFLPQAAGGAGELGLLDGPVFEG